MALMDKLVSLIGGNVLDGTAKIISLFKVDPNVAAANAEKIAEIQLEMQGKIVDSVTAEIQTGGDIIKAEAQSQSWLPRNVRPLLLLLWGIAITANQFVPIVARFWLPSLLPFPVDPWVYKLTAIGFTGYVTARTWEKVTDTDK